MALREDPELAPYLRGRASGIYLALVEAECHTGTTAELVDKLRGMYINQRAHADRATRAEDDTHEFPVGPSTRKS